MLEKASEGGKLMDRVKTNIIPKLAIAGCCAMVLGLSAFAGTGVYTTSVATGQVAQGELCDDHTQLMLARTIGGNPTSNEWDWEVSADSAESTLP